MQNGLARQWRVKLLPLLGAVIAVKYLLLAKGMHRGFGFRIFFVGCLAVILSWWLMDRKDLRHLQEQEELAAQDPKHLFDISTGIKTNPRERMGIILGLMMMGMGLLIAAFAVGSIGFILIGASCCLIAGSIWALT
jgi:hypothetical protein